MTGRRGAIEGERYDRAAGPAATGTAIRRADDPMFEQAGNEYRGSARRA